jgi:hypothetical protein
MAAPRSHPGDARGDLYRRGAGGRCAIAELSRTVVSAGPECAVGLDEEGVTRAGGRGDDPSATLSGRLLGIVVPIPDSPSALRPEAQRLPSCLTTSAW